MDFFTPLIESPEGFLIMVGIVGLLLGSFVNVVVWRLPIMLEAGWKSQAKAMLDLDDEPVSGERFDLLLPASHCPSCQTAIPFYFNIPLLGYLLLLGRCHHCKTRISLRYPIVELITAALFLVVAAHFGPGWPFVAATILTLGLIVLTLIDLDHQLLPDSITLPLMWLGLLLSLFSVFVDSQSSILGAVVGYLSLWLLYHGFRLLTGKHGMGYGDFKMFAMLGAWLGWFSLPWIILLASLTGSVIGIAYIALSGGDRNKTLPFGPFLALSGWAMLLWGDKISGAYLSWIS